MSLLRRDPDDFYRDESGEFKISLTYDDDCYHVHHLATQTTVKVPRHAVYPLDKPIPRTAAEAQARLFALVRETLLTMRSTTIATPSPLLLGDGERV